MKHPLVLFATLAAVWLFAGGAMACTVTYKAKQDDPLRLEVGKADLSGAACQSEQAAAAELGPRLAAQGWTLLAIVAIEN